MNDKELVTRFPIGCSIEFELALLDRRRELELRILRADALEHCGQMFDAWMGAIRSDIAHNLHGLRDLCRAGGILDFIDGLDMVPREEPETATVTTIHRVPPPLEILIEEPGQDGHTHAWRYANQFFPTNPPIWHMHCAGCKGWALLGNQLDQDSTWLGYSTHVHERRLADGTPTEV